MSDLFVGSISDVRAYDRALTANEIMKLYEYDTVPKAGYTKAATVKSDTTELVHNNYDQHFVLESNRFIHFMEIKDKKWKAPAIYLNGERVLKHTKKYTIRYLVEKDRLKRSAISRWEERRK